MKSITIKITIKKNRNKIFSSKKSNKRNYKVADKC